VEQRLTNAYKLIEELNEKLRNCSSSTQRGSIAQLLQKIREQLNSEFERYRCDTEESMKRTLTEMKSRLDQRLRENQRLQEERDRLEDVLAKIKGELNQIQSQVSLSFFLYILIHFMPPAPPKVLCFWSSSRPSVRCPSVNTYLRDAISLYLVDESQ